jgi:hypothetical protein
VEGIRILLLAVVIAAMMGGTLYVGAQGERVSVPPAREAMPRVEPSAEPDIGEPPSPEPDATPEETEAFEPVLSVGVDFAEGADLFPRAEDIVLAGGLRIGPVAFGVAEEPELEAQPAETTDSEVSASPRRRTRRARARPPVPRLHPDPGMHSILTARRMMASGERIQGSCYKYLSTVYERAGHRSWRKRRIVYREERDGPYADLDLVRPGDWLYIVNDPQRTPVGTHSVMFVRWTDRARGYASVISHPGWGAPHTGAQRTYDISRTYRIIRPTM